MGSCATCSVAFASSPPLSAAATAPCCVLAPRSHRRRPPPPHHRSVPHRRAPSPPPTNSASADARARHPPSRRPSIPSPPPPPPQTTSQPPQQPRRHQQQSHQSDQPDSASDRQSQQKAYLQRQLELRQKQKLAAKQALSQKSHRTQKRSRAPSRLPSRHSSNALKDTFQMYMDEISRNDLLAQSQVIHLATQIKHAVAIENEQRQLQTSLGRRPSIAELSARLGIAPAQLQTLLMAGTAAKNTLVSANLRLVTSVARKVASSKTGAPLGLALDDMVQEGSVGLIRAAEKFDASRGYKFSTYATWWIRAYVMRSITTQSRSIKVPGTIVDEYARIKKEYNRLREQGQIKPREEQVARALRITPAKLRFVINVVTRKPISLDLSLDPSGDSSNSRSLGEVVEGDDRIEERMVEAFQKQELDLALRACLRPLERAVIRLRFGLDDGQPRTLRETGELLGLSKERIRQLIFRALPKMKTPEIQRMLTDATTR